MHHNHWFDTILLDAIIMSNYPKLDDVYMSM